GEGLNRVRVSGREVPQIALPNVVDEVAPVLVDGGDAGRAGDHVGPLRLRVPVHLAHTAGVAGIEAHVHPGDGGRARELAHGDLAAPATVGEPRVGARE